MPRLKNKRCACVHAATPFGTIPGGESGFSLYARAGTTLLYRVPRLTDGGVGPVPVDKTNRVASGAASPLQYALPAEWADGPVAVDVRRYESGIENETDNYRVFTGQLDGSLDVVTEILGTATLLDTEVRAGGVVRLRFAWTPSRDGVQPDTFRASRTAGPTAPADVTAAVVEGQRIVEIDTPALQDGAYTYEIVAETDAGTTTKTLIEDITFTADASGPPAPTSGTARAW